jgi:lysyl oxidase-like protein 2/3/4
VIDIGVYDSEIAPNGCVGYNSRNQGITAGCQDTYSRSLQCQWVDITDIEDGSYRLSVITNPRGIIRELNQENNSATITVEINGDQVIVREE